MHNNNTKSSNSIVKNGVPQGSVLGRLLFLVKINDLQNASSFKLRLFADDTLLCIESKNIVQSQSYINDKLKKVEIWLNEGLLVTRWR